jgi:hypothetical protein
MECYKLVITDEQKYGSISSYGVLIKVIGETYADAANNEIGFMYLETATFPKAYYFITTNPTILTTFKTSYIVEQAECPPALADSSEKYSFIGNSDFFQS